MAAQQTEPKSYPVPALEKGLDILETLSSAATPLSLTDLARKLDRSSSELFRMVDCLEKRGYIVKDENTGNYMLSLKLYQLAHTHSPVEQLTKAAAKPMRLLAAEIQESCHLSVLRNGELIVLLQEESPQKMRLSFEVGASFPMLHTVSGRMLLSQLAEPDRQALLAEDPGFRMLAEADKLQASRQLELIRKQRFSAAENESLLGIQDIAVIVGNSRTGPLAALAVAYLQTADSKKKSDQVLHALQRCAAAIEQALGGII